MHENRSGTILESDHRACSISEAYRVEELRAEWAECTFQRTSFRVHSCKGYTKT